jgi:hypothetical protein
VWAATAVWGQNARDRFVLESIRPTTATSESFSPIAQSAAGKLLEPDLSKYDLDMTGLVDGLSLKRNFSQERIDAKGSPLSVGWRQRQNTEGGLTVFGRTKLGFSMLEESVSNLRQDNLKSLATRMLSIEQGFGSGVRTGALGFSRTVITRDGIQDRPDTLTTQAVNLTAALRAGLTTTTSFTTKDSAQGTGQKGQEYLSSWAVPFSGGAGAFAYGQSDYLLNGVRTIGQRMDFAAPLALMGQKLTLERHYNNFAANGVVSRDESDKFALPLKFSGGAGVFSYTNTRADKPGLQQLLRQMDIAAPIMLGGQKLDIARHINSDLKNGAQVVDNNEHLILPWKFSGGAGLVQFVSTEVNKPGLSQTTDQVDLAMPLMYQRQKVTLERHIMDMTKNGVRTLDATDRFALPVKFSGGLGLFALTETGTIKPGVDQTVKQTDLLLPLALHRRTYTFERNDADTLLNGVAMNDLRTRIAGPAAFLNKTATFDYTIAQHSQTNADSETRTAHLATPVNLLGHTLATDYTDITLDTGATRQQQQITKILAPMAGQNLDFSRRIISSDNGQTETQQTITQVITPKFSMLDRRADVGARVLRTENDGGYTQEIRAIDVRTQPIKPLTVQGTVEQRDLGPNEGGQTRELKTIYSASDRLKLNARYLENEAANHAPTVQRYMDITTKPKSGFGIAMRAGVISWAQEGQLPSSARRVDAQLGDPKKLSVQALYTEYDDQKLIAMPHPTVGVAMRAGDPSRLAMQLKYTDQTGRLEEERGVALQFHAIGGAMQLGYTENPLDPTGKVVRLATVYDANLERKLFGNVNLNFGYRYLDYNDSSAFDDHYASIQLAGGNEAGGGQIKLGYFSGDFVPVVQGKVTPEATLDLSFSRKWGEEGKIGVTLRRTTMPLGQSAGANGNEGRVEYQTHF